MCEEDAKPQVSRRGFLVAAAASGPALASRQRAMMADLAETDVGVPPEDASPGDAVAERLFALYGGEFGGSR